MTGIVNISNPVKPEWKDQWIPDSDWHMVGGAGEPAFENSWVNFGGGTYGDAAFRIDAEGWVHLKGLVKSGTYNAAIFTLPEGYRPSERIFMTGICGGNTPSRLSVKETGVVSFAYTGGSTSYGSLQTIHFKANNDRPTMMRGYRPASPWGLYSNADYRKPFYAQRRNGFNYIGGITIGLDVLGTSNRATLGKLLPSFSSKFGISENAVNMESFQTSPKLNCKQATSYTTLGILSHEYGRTEIDNEWVELGLAESPTWTPYGIVDTEDLWTKYGYYKDQFGFVHLTGMVKSTGLSTDDMFTLPVGYRPAERLIYPTKASGASNATRVDIYPTGVVSPVTNASTTWTSIANICFYAEG